MSTALWQDPLYAAWLIGHSVLENKEEAEKRRERQSALVFLSAKFVPAPPSFSFPSARVNGRDQGRFWSIAFLTRYSESLYGYIKGALLPRTPQSLFPKLTLWWLFLFIQAEHRVKHVHAWFQSGFHFSICLVEVNQTCCGFVAHPYWGKNIF